MHSRSHRYKYYVTWISHALSRLSPVSVVTSADLAAKRADEAQPEQPSRLTRWLKNRSPLQSAFIYSAVEVGFSGSRAALLFMNPVLAVSTMPLMMATKPLLNAYMLYTLLPNAKKSSVYKAYARYRNGEPAKHSKPVAALFGFASHMATHSRIVRAEKHTRDWLHRRTPVQSAGLYFGIGLGFRAITVGTLLISPWLTLGWMATRKVTLKPLRLYMLYHLLPNLKRSQIYKEIRIAKKLRHVRAERKRLFPRTFAPVPSGGALIF